MNYWLRYRLKRLSRGLSHLLSMPQLFFERRVLARSRERLSALARKWGLEHKPGEEASQFGELHGSLNGHPVSVKPDEAGMVIVPFRNEIDITFMESYSPPGDHVNLGTNNPRFDTIFRFREAGPETAEQLRTHSELYDEIADFYDRWTTRIEEFEISRWFLKCKMLHNPFIPTISAEDLEQSLPEMVALVGKLETHLDNGGRAAGPDAP